MKKPTEAFVVDKDWNKRERLLYKLFLEYFSLPESDDIISDEMVDPDKLAEALDLLLKGNK